MSLIKRISNARAARRAGYKRNQVNFSKTDGRMFESATGREICPLSLFPCEVENTANGYNVTVFQKNSNTPIGTAFAQKGEIQ